MVAVPEIIQHAEGWASNRVHSSNRQGLRRDVAQCTARFENRALGTKLQLAPGVADG